MLRGSASRNGVGTPKLPITFGGGQGGLITALQTQNPPEDAAQAPAHIGKRRFNPRSLASVSLVCVLPSIVKEMSKHGCGTKVTVSGPSLWGIKYAVANVSASHSRCSQRSRIRARR